MKYYIDKKGNVHSQYSLGKCIYLITGKEYGVDKIEKKIYKHFPMIVREVAPAEWKLVAKSSKISAVILYRQAHNCSIKEASDAVEKYLGSEN